MIAYVKRQPFGRSHLHVMNADGTGDHAITSGSWSEYDPQWSPDGKLIAYDSNQGGADNVWVTNATGGGVRQLTHGAGFNIEPAWQPVPPTPATAPLPATTDLAPSQPTPEARLGGVSIKAGFLIAEDIADLQERNLTGALAGLQLASDAELLHKQTLPIVPTTPGGQLLKRDLLRMDADAVATGRTYTEALRNALLGKRAAVLRDAEAYQKDVRKLIGAYVAALAAS